MLADTCSVLIVGGGPCGLMLANELGRRGIDTILVDEKPTTAFNPQANATQARTMEHFRRLGFAGEIRSLGMPPEFPTDIAYFTRYATHELARYRLPSSKEARARVTGLSGSWSAAELPHRVSQKFVEQVLRQHAERLPGISLNYGCRLLSFTEGDDCLHAVIERVEDGTTCGVQSRYLVGADGPRSRIREQLGFYYEGSSGVIRDFMGGRMYAIYLRAPDFYEVVPHPVAWMNVAFNKDRRAFMTAVDGKGEFAFHTQLHAHEDPDQISDVEALAMFEAAVGAPVKAQILSRGTWTAGHSLVANHFQSGRVFLGGDAVHLFTPTGGLGYNTAVEDAVNLGWKLAATISGYGGPNLLRSYEEERRPLAIRNTEYARKFADSLGLFEPAAQIEDEGVAGIEARAVAGSYLETHARAEFNIPGVTFGGRYDASSIIVSDGCEPPEDAANIYTPTACPGGRAPHIWLPDGRSLYDAFSFEWTLLRLGGDPQDCSALIRTAEKSGVPLQVVDVPEPGAREIYQAPLALIRPDQIVAWRGHVVAEANAVLAAVTGYSTELTGRDTGVPSAGGSHHA
jgi:2-polyprenyl-6-methoxyphenol hydroxylase-like FAD-dependent oxidoreductase